MCGWIMSCKAVERKWNTSDLHRNSSETDRFLLLKDRKEEIENVLKIVGFHTFAFIWIM